MLQGKNLFLESQIRDNCRVFYAQMTSGAVHYDVIYHFFPINSQYLNTLEVDSPGLDCHWI